MILLCYFLLKDYEPAVHVSTDSHVYVDTLHVLGKQFQLQQHTVRRECRLHATPWFLAGKKYARTQLIFYGKPIMQALRHICVERGWKMTLILDDTDVGLRELQRLTSDPHTFTIVYTSSRAFHRQTIRQLANATNALVSGVRYVFLITGAKKGQLKAFRSFFSKHGCNLKDKGIMPRSFILDNPEDCTQFFKYSQQRPHSWWILKPSQGYGGEGITIHKNMSHFYKNYALCADISGREQLVVQEYLSNLLLLEGRKFDVRGFVVIAGTTPYILFYHEGYLRLSVERFDAKKGGNGVHLTNSHIQTQAKNFSVSKHYWSFQRFQDYLDEHHPENEEFVSKTLVPFIQKVGLFILQTGKLLSSNYKLKNWLKCLCKIGLSVFERSPSSFHLLGLDFMITEDLRVWFIEANSYPLWPKVSSSRETSFIDELMETMGVCVSICHQ